MKKNEEKIIYVYADWEEPENCRLLGVLSSVLTRGKEIFSFEYDTAWVKNVNSLYIDPNLGLYPGKQYLPDDKPNFGIFLDSSPDRWGRLLMRRREALWAKQENRKERSLTESDYLLGVYDGHRMGGLRFKTDPRGDFMDNHKDLASPPWSSLRELEYASLQLEDDNATNKPDYSKWLNMLIHPGSSLGGARPKSGVVDEKNRLWIAKFPSRYDSKDSGAWEFVLNNLALSCGIIVPEARLLKLTGKHHTFLSKRFDRTNISYRIHFASAMTLLGYNDGNDHNDGVSYLELASFIIRFGGNVEYNLEQLWRRILFNILVSNTDDHLRNHGFLLTPSGWQLSPAYDMNPDEYGSGLHLNITETSNELDISLALSVAKYFKLTSESADKILKEMRLAISNWKAVAKKAGIHAAEVERVAGAFRH